MFKPWKIFTLFILLFHFQLALADQKLILAIKNMVIPEKFCQIQLEKNYKSPILSTQKTSTGTIRLYKNKFSFEQIDQESKTKNVIIFNGKHFWVLEYENQSESHPLQITRTKSAPVAQILKGLFSQEELEKTFNITEKHNGYFKLELRKKTEIVFKKIEIGIDSQKINYIELVDDLDNVHRYQIQSQICTSFKKSNQKFFHFVPKPTDTIIDL